MANALIVFTVVTRGYDTLAPVPESWRGKAEFVAFVEEDCDASGWKFERLDRQGLDAARAVRRYKLMPHLIFPEYNYSLWMDGSIMIKETSSPEDLLARYLHGQDWAAFRHRKRTCIYDEADACIAAGKESDENIRRQVDAYRADGCPAGLGLAECTVLLRRHSPAVRAVSEEWYRQVLRYSKRDQISFNYVAWKTGFAYGEFEGTIARNDHFVRRKHTADTAPPMITSSQASA